MGATIKDVATACKIDLDTIRHVLRESPGHKVPREVQDVIFNNARRLGYDLRKLKLGKRMNLRRETILDLLTQIEKNKKWGRKEILAHLRTSIELVDRVHRRAFQEEFGS